MRIQCGKGRLTSFLFEFYNASQFAIEQSFLNEGGWGGINIFVMIFYTKSQNRSVKPFLEKSNRMRENEREIFQTNHFMHLI